MLLIFLLKLRGLVPAHLVMAWMKSLCLRQIGHTRTHHTTLGCILKVLNQSRWGEIQCREEPCVNGSCIEMMEQDWCFRQHFTHAQQGHSRHSLSSLRYQSSSGLVSESMGNNRSNCLFKAWEQCSSGPHRRCRRARYFVRTK